MEFPKRVGNVCVLSWPPSDGDSPLGASPPTLFRLQLAFAPAAQRFFRLDETPLRDHTVMACPFG